MKKIVLATVLALLLVMCKTPGTASSGNVVKEKPGIQYLDDFPAASETEKAAVLKELNATGAGYSVLILTQNYKGEKIVVSNAKKRLYSDYTISNLKTGIAGKLRIDNKVDTKVYDNLSKSEVTIEAAEAQKHKYVYLKKNPGSKNTFTITYSNTLRPLEL